MTDKEFIDNTTKELHKICLYCKDKKCDESCPVEVIFKLMKERFNQKDIISNLYEDFLRNK